ncbi:hypothetical protein DL98DRAFT_523642 [Cadophora sp. DSE1049]|nr:hypothetical protein DL98DRAFT_523642 [Cadophora sp. DSE1049]
MESSLELSEEMRKAIFHRFNENKQEPRRVRQGEDEPNFEDPEFYKKFFERCVVRFQQDEMIEKGLFDAAWTRDISRLVTFARSGPDTIANTVNDTVNSSSSQGAQHNTVPTPGPSLPGFDEHSSGPGNKTKQRVKLGVSCDLCRQRKVKCDRIQGFGITDFDMDAGNMGYGGASFGGSRTSDMSS